MTGLQKLLLVAALPALAARTEDIVAKNEASVGAVLQQYVQAQMAYRRTDHNGDGVFEFAQTLHGNRKAPDAPDSPNVSGAEQQRIADLIRALGADAYNARENAALAILRLGAKACPQLQAALRAETDAEIISRAQKLYEEILQNVAPARKLDLRWGLYSSGRSGQPDGDLQLIDKAFAEAECPPGCDPTAIPAKDGYLFRVLLGQGNSAPGGARSYIFNGHMTSGFGLLAFPKEYAKTGRKCFMFSNAGVTLTRDLGNQAATDAFVRNCTIVDPAWQSGARTP